MSFGTCLRGQEPSQQVFDHESMGYREMADVMQMDDTTRFGKVMFDQFEWRSGGADEARAAWDIQAWYGGDYDKVWLKTEGQYVADSTHRAAPAGVAIPSGGVIRDKGVRDSSVDALWNRVISRWWSLQVGARQDFGPGQARSWAAAGVQGLAPQWFDTEATLYLAEQGRVAARLKAQYELFLTQRLVVQPYLETNLYSRADVRRQIGAGLSDLELSLRLRYELRREVAPYVGLVWLRRFGGTADQVRAIGGDAGSLQLTAGMRVWF